MMYTGKHFNVLYVLVNLLHDVGVWTIDCIYIIISIYIIFIYAGIHRLLDIGTYIYIYIPGNSEDTFSPIAWSTVWAIYREYVYINIRVYIYIHIYIFSRPKTRSIPNISTFFRQTHVN